MIGDYDFDYIILDYGYDYNVLIMVMITILKELMVVAVQEHQFFKELNIFLAMEKSLSTGALDAGVCKLQASLDNSGKLLLLSFQKFNGSFPSARVNYGVVCAYKGLIIKA